MMDRKPNRRVTIADVAQAAGVSATTVSFVLQDKGRISKKTRATVRRAMNDLGYVYDRAAASLRTRTSRLVGLIIHDLANPFFAELASGVESGLAERGFLPVIGDSHEDRDRQTHLMRTMGEHGVVGFVVCSARNAIEADLGIADAFHAPCVLCVRDLHFTRFDFIGSDNRRGTRMAVEHLVESGHTRIAFVGGTRDATPRIDRFDAYRSALDRAGIPVDEDLVVDCPPTRTAGREAAATLLARRKPFTAAFCYNDVVAFGFCSGLRSRNLIAGTDVSVVGYDNVFESDAWKPALTTVETSPRTVGTEAARLLLRRLDDPQVAPITVLLPPRLVLRDSTRALT